MAADQLEQSYDAFAVGTTFVVHFKYEGNPFRVQFSVSDNLYGYTFMEVHSGSEGEMTIKNRVERRKIYCRGRSLRQCVVVGLTRRCEVNPTDIRLGEILPPRDH